MARDLIAILALDLGTSAFKAATVCPDGSMSTVSKIRYALDSGDGRVMCTPDRYWRACLKGVRAAAESARCDGLRPAGIAVTGQAQTFLALDGSGAPIGPAVVWTDAAAAEEALAAGRALPDFARTSGFLAPSPLQFLPKVMRLQRAGSSARRFLLLHEWLALRLTGSALGETCSQSMGGFWDAAADGWNGRALALAGIGPESLAEVGRCGALSAPLTRAAQRALGLPALPVFVCGNDQSTAALGAGIAQNGGLYGGFGTAMAIYGMADRPLAPSGRDQIAGISPIAGRWFLLGVESECGSALERLAKRRRITPEALVASALRPESRRSHAAGRAAEQVRGELERLAGRASELMRGLEPALGRPRLLIAGGGLARSAEWLRLLERTIGIEVRACDTEHPGLRGAAQIALHGMGAEIGTPV